MYFHIMIQHVAIHINNFQERVNDCDIQVKLPGRVILLPCHVY